mgnify:CR=1 FL=1
MTSVKKCTACAGPVSKEIVHPLLYVPICITCDFHYNNGEFTIEHGNEIYCRLCGEGEGDSLLLCDTCPKSFCSRCIENTVGKSELRRIQALSDRWHCFVCSPQPIQDLCLKNNWKYHPQTTAARKNTRKGVVFADISRGREKFEIPVINEVDKAEPPLDFVYVAHPVAGDGVTLVNDPDQLGCCTCTDNCRDPLRCECSLAMGGSFAYDETGVIMNEKPGGIFECNARCSCHVSRCKNRIVGNGPNLRLEVFRCDNPLKGWGVRCKTDILPGTYIADYLGEVLLEEDSEKRGLMLNDEYLFTQDFWGRSCALEKLADLGIKQHLHSVPREEDQDITAMDKEDVSRFLDAELVELLDRKGAIGRALQIGKDLRADPVRYIARMEQQFSGLDQDYCTVIPTQGAKPKARGRINKGGVIDLDSDDLSQYASDDSAPSGKAKSSKGGKKRPLSEATTAVDKYEGVQYKSWYDYHLVARQKALDQAISVISDRTMLEVERTTQTYTIDGR